AGTSPAGVRNTTTPFSPQREAAARRRGPSRPPATPPAGWRPSGRRRRHQVSLAPYPELAARTVRREHSALAASGQGALASQIPRVPVTVAIAANIANAFSARVEAPEFPGLHRIQIVGRWFARASPLVP